MSKIRKSAKGKECQVRIPGVCNHNSETTVLAHVGKIRGMGLKASDIEATYCCSACHDVIDGRSKSEFSKLEVKVMAYEGAERTRLILQYDGLIKVAQ